MIAAGLLIQSCGGTKQVATTTVPANQQMMQDVEVEVNACEEYAMKEPSKRAAGVGVHFSETTATNLAQLNARNNLARALQQCVKNASSYSANAKELFASDAVANAFVGDEEASSNDSEEGWAKELIKGAPIVMKKKYKTPNNRWRIYVCVEYQEGLAEMAGKVAQIFQEKLTPEQKARIDFNAEKFRAEMAKAMEGYKGVTEQ